MKTIGIVCEYNPFHKGHKYQIDSIRNKFKDSNIVCLMSGDFVQRGEIAIRDKFDRANYAIKNDIDLILELPTIFCISSAEKFAKGAIEIFNALKIDVLSFGSEIADIKELKRASKILFNEEEYRELFNKNLKNGHSYSTAKKLAIEKTYGDLNLESNDMLAACYINYLNKDIEIYAVKRYGSKYNDIKISSEFPSAMAIRNELYKNKSDNSYLFLDDLYTSIANKLIFDNLDDIYNLTPSLVNRMKNAALCSNTIDEFIENTASRNFSLGQIRRAMISIYLNIDNKNAKRLLRTTYLRPLAFNEKGRNLLNKYKKLDNLEFYNSHNKDVKFAREFSFKVNNMYNLLSKSDRYKDKRKKVTYFENK